MRKSNLVVALSLVILSIAAPLSGLGDGKRSPKNATVMHRMADGSVQRVSSDSTLARRQHALAAARPILQEHGISLNTDVLASWNWSHELRPTLANLPQMLEHTTRTDLDGVIMADELRLGEVTELLGDTIIIANRLVFEGQNPVIRGPYDVYIVVAESVIAGASFDRQHGKQLRTIDTSGLGRPAPQRMTVSLADDSPETHLEDEAELGGTSSGRPAPSPTTAAAFLAGSGTPGADGSAGSQGQAGDQGEIGGAGSQGDCSQSNPNGETGGSGTLGQDGLGGGQGGDGQRGGNGGNQYLQIYQDEGWWSLDASGGDGGNGGAGGNGGNGGRGGKGGEGGQGVDCACNEGGSGSGGIGGTGGEGGIGGDGGEGGWGGDGGDAGHIEIHVYTEPACQGGVVVDINIQGGFGGQGGAGGAHGSLAAGGAGGDGGSPGGNQICPSTQGQSGSTGSTGTQGGGSPSAGVSGPNGNNGEYGSYDLYTYYY